MASRRRSDEEPSESRDKRYRPATTPEGRENQLIDLAYHLVEKKIRNGTASSQEITHFLKLGSSREKIEQHKLQVDVELAEAKIEMMKQGARMEELYTDAISAMRSYSGQAPLELPMDFDDD